eukprot:TRINITY_DN3827_c0_g1_i1.p1 TRINITY_DN3827_c0_g1~~TRINITY_DN3827_c0_g1_i1.p1  ORF type:complete len:404 (-),score=61.21 TRINITY_DN3827_c0_g1_i1:15-1226(-)
MTASDAISPDERTSLVPNKNHHADQPKSLWNWKLPIAMVFLLALVTCWIAMAEILQDMQSSTSASSHYSKPYFMVFVVHGSYTIFLVICAVWVLCRVIYRRYIKPCSDPVFDMAALKRKTIVGLCLNPIMISCAYVWYLSLPRTTVAANTGIYNSSCVFVYALSCIFLSERITLGKVGSVFICIGGVALMAVSQSQAEHAKNHGDVVGYLLVLLSTALYALFEVLVKKYGDEHKHENVSTADHAFGTMLFLGLTGLITLLMYWPIIIILNYAKAETFEMPTAQIWGVLLANGGLDCVFNVLLLITIMLTSPLFVSVGSLMTIPVSIIADKVIHHMTPGPLSFVGAALIVIGFIGMNVAEYFAGKRAEKRKLAAEEAKINEEYPKKLESNVSAGNPNFWRDRLY